MTTFNIISIGDVEFLGNVLNSVAMVCGTGDFKQLCICGFIIGLLFIGFQCIFQGGQRINLQHTFTCFICYMLFFGPSCTVVVEDAGGSSYTRTVDNVPIGVGIAGTAISGIGYGVTHLMQQAFGTLDSNRNYGYIEPLKIVAGLRNAGYSDSIWSSLDVVCGAGCNTKESVMNYVNECTANAIRLGFKTPDEVYKADLRNNGISVIKFDSETLMTKLVIPAEGGLVGENHDGLVTCKDGFTILQNNVFAKLREPQIAFSVNQLLGIRELSDTGKSTPQDWSQINGAFATLGISANDAQDWMLGTVVKPVYEQATIKNYRNFQDGQIAQTINTAITQRNVQWASEQTMFVSVCRGIMSFFEGFVYAITPIVGFMLMIGAFGLGLVGKYFMVLAWIQLWLPCMAICNMYTLSGLRSELTTSPIGAAVSFYALDDSYQRVANWVSTGGMLFAATPLLALFVISGSMYAFTTLASRLNGQDHFNEKNVAPDVQQVGALQVTAPRNQNDILHGTRATGYEHLLPDVSMQQLGSFVSSASSTLANQKMEQATAALKAASGTSEGASVIKQYGENFSRSYLSSLADGHSTTQQLLRATGASGQISESKMSEVAGTVEGVARFGVGAGGQYERTLGNASGSIAEAEAVKKSADQMITARGLGDTVQAQVVQGADGKYATRIFGVKPGDQKVADTVKDAVTPQGNGKTPTSVGLNGDLGVSAKTSNTDKMGHGESYNTDFSTKDSSGLSSSLQSTLQKNAEASSQSALNTTLTTTNNYSSESSLGRAISEAQTATRAAQRISSSVSAIGSNQRIDAVALSNSLLNAGGKEWVNKLLSNNMGARSVIKSLEDTNKSVGLMSNDQALMTATVQYFTRGMASRDQASQFGQLLAKSDLPLNFGVPKEVNVGDLKQPGSYQAMTHEVYKDDERRRATIAKDTEKLQPVEFDHDKEVVRDEAKDENDPQIKPRFNQKEYESMAHARKAAYNQLTQPAEGRLVDSAAKTNNFTSIDGVLRRAGEIWGKVFGNGTGRAPGESDTNITDRTGSVWGKTYPDKNNEGEFLKDWTNFEKSADDRVATYDLTNTQKEFVKASYWTSIRRNDPEAVKRYEQAREALKNEVTMDVYRDKGIAWQGGLQHAVNDPKLKDTNPSAYEFNQRLQKANDEALNATNGMMDHLVRLMDTREESAGVAVRNWNLANGRIGPRGVDASPDDVLKR